MREDRAVIRSGHLLQPINIGKEKTQLINTCPFDSLVEILSTTYIDSIYYKSVLDQIPRSEFTNAVISFAVHGVGNTLYKQRATVLSKIMPNRSGTINCAYHVSNLAKLLVGGVPNMIQKTYCTNCEYSTSTNLPVVDIDTSPI